MDMNSNKEYDLLEDNIRQTFASIVWTHKIQEQECDILTNKYKVMEVIKIAFAGLTSAGIISSFFVDPWWVKLISAIMSFVVIFINAYSTTFDSKNEIQRHKATALQLLSLRNRFIDLLMELKLKKQDLDYLYLKYEDYREQLNIIYQTSPNTSNKAVHKASDALYKRRDNTYAQSEIDSFLPPTLRKGEL